jgi:hypothetical protein
MNQKPNNRVTKEDLENRTKEFLIKYILKLDEEWDKFKKEKEKLRVKKTKKNTPKNETKKNTSSKKNNLT